MPTSSSTTSAGACRPPPIPRRPMPADHATVCGGSCRPPPIPRRPMPPMARFWCAPTCRPPPIPRRPMPRLQPRRPDRPVVRPQFRGDQCLRSVDLHDLEPVVRPQFRGDQCHRRGRYGYSRPVVRPQFRGDQCLIALRGIPRRPVVRPQFRGDQCRDRRQGRQGPPVVRPQFRGDQCRKENPSPDALPVVRPQFRGDQCRAAEPSRALHPVVRPQFRGDQCPRADPPRWQASCRPPPIPRRPMPTAPRALDLFCLSSAPNSEATNASSSTPSSSIHLSSAPNSEATNAPSARRRRPPCPVVRPQFRGDQCRGNTNPLPRHDNIAFRPLEFTERMRRARGFRRAHRRPRSGWESHRPDSGAAPRAPGSATTARPGPACPAKGISGRRSTA